MKLYLLITFIAAQSCQNPCSCPGGFYKCIDGGCVATSNYHQCDAIGAGNSTCSKAYAPGIYCPSDGKTPGVCSWLPCGDEFWLNGAASSNITTSAAAPSTSTLVSSSIQTTTTSIISPPSPGSLSSTTLAMTTLATTTSATTTFATTTFATITPGSVSNDAFTSSNSLILVLLAFLGY